MNEAEGVSGPDGGVAEGLGDEALAHPRGTHQKDVFALEDELQGEHGVQPPAVQSKGNYLLYTSRNVA